MDIGDSANLEQQQAFNVKPRDVPMPDGMANTQEASVHPLNATQWRPEIACEFEELPDD